MFRNDIDAAMERARIAEEQLRRLEAKEEKSQEELDALRAEIETQQAEIAKLRKLAPLRAPVRRRQQLAVVVAISVSIAALGALGFFLVVGRAPPRKVRVVRVGTAEPSVARRAQEPSSRAAATPTAELSPPLAVEIGDEAMTALLTAKPWRSDWLKGELRFVRGESGLEGRLASGGSERNVAVKLGKLATLELRVMSEASGITERLTFFGAVSRDRMTIRGTVDKLLVEGANQHAEQGVFTLNAVR